MESLVRIARAFDRLLETKGCSNPNWSVHLDSRQAVGFFPENSETNEALVKFEREEYNSLLEGLQGVADSYGPHEARSMFREKVYSDSLL